MVEKFAEYESKAFLDCEGSFVFEIKAAELKDGKADKMVVFEVESDKYKATLYHSLSPKARWSYNNLISACLKLTPEKRKTFELDYETIHNKLIGKKFLGNVEVQAYKKIEKVMLDDGTFGEQEIVKDGYKITSYEEC